MSKRPSKQYTAMAKGKKTAKPGLTPIWVKDNFTVQPLCIRFNKDSMIFDLLQYLVDNEVFDSWTESRINYMNVWHNDTKVDHDTLICDISGITRRQPLVVVRVESFKKLLDHFMVTPSANHEPKVIHYLIPEAQDYSHFVEIVKSCLEEVNLNEPGDEDLSVSTLEMFKVLPNEGSVMVHVALLLFLSLRGIKEVKIIPSFPIEIPEKKKGPPYQTDFLIKSDHSYSGVDFVLLKENIHDNIPIMLIEVKSSVNIDLCKVNPQYVIELLVYCQYIMRLYKLTAILGSLTDGLVWHTMKIGLDSELCSLLITKYTVIYSTDKSKIVGAIPKLFKLY